MVLGCRWEGGGDVMLGCKCGVRGVAAVGLGLSNEGMRTSDVPSAAISAG